ncbi:hypothetical protein D3C81_644150 [compost metagenome]
MAVEQGQAVVGQHRVHGRHRLIGQQHLRPLVQRPGNTHPLQLATGQLPALHEQFVGQAQLGQGLARPRHITGVQQVEQPAQHTPLPQSASQHRRHHPLARWQGRRLVHQAYPRTQALAGPGGQRPGLFAEQLQAPAAGLDGGRHQVQQAGLARPRRPDDGDALALADAQAHGIKRTHLAMAQPGPVQMNSHVGSHCRCHLSRPASRAACSVPT